MSIVEAERFQTENLDPTPDRIKSVESALGIFYGDMEGVRAPSLDHLVPLYMSSVPARRHLTYDSLTGKVDVRKQEGSAGGR